MDNLTHGLFGLMIGRALFAKRGNWVGPAMFIAGNLPDAESILSIGVPKAHYLLDHRGWSHSAIGVVIGSIVLAGVVWGLGRIFPGRVTSNDQANSYPPSFGSILLPVFLGVSSHIFLDWLNTYGVKPWVPFDERRFYGDAAFIIDPWMWLVLIACGICGTVFTRTQWALWTLIVAATSAVVAWGAKTELIPWTIFYIWCGVLAIAIALRWGFFKQPDRAWTARMALILWSAYVGALVHHSRKATELVTKKIGEIQSRRDPNFAISANPTPGIPWRFTVLVQTSDRLDQYSVDLRKNITVREKRIDPNLNDPALAAVSETLEYRAWKSFARHPVVERRDGQLILGDARYRIGARGDWSELSVPLPADAPPSVPPPPAPNP